MVLSERARLKTAFVSSYGKLEFRRCPFALAQAPAYFQRLVNEVLSGLDFASGYLDDILVFGPDMATHLQCLRCLILSSQKSNFNFMKKTYTIPRTYCIRKSYNTFTRKTFQYQKDASTWHFLLLYLIRF